MRRNWKKAVALFIAGVMFCIQPMQSVRATEQEEIQKEYVARLRQFDSISAMKKAGYEPIRNDEGEAADFNEGTGKKAVYVGYVRTKNPEEAITDIAVMDMKGGYIFNEYKDVIKTQKEEVDEKLSGFKAAIKEFRENYQKDSIMAKYAYDQMSYYVDGKTGDAYAGNGIEKDTGKKISQLFMDEYLSDKKLEKILLQASGTMLRNIDIYLAMATVNPSGERLLKKASKLKKKQIPYKQVKKNAQKLVEYLPNLQEELSTYADDPLENVADEAELQTKLQDYDQDEQASYLYSMALYLLLDQCAYEGTTLAQLILEEEVTWRDMARLAACMSEAQVVLSEYIGLGQMLMLSSANGKTWRKATQDTAYVQNINCVQENIKLHLEKEKNMTAKEAAKAVSCLSIYEGAERSIYESGVGLTTAALRKTVSTDDSAALWSDSSNVTEGILLGMAGTVFIVGISVAAVFQTTGKQYAAGVYSGLAANAIDWSGTGLHGAYKKLLSVTPVLSMEDAAAFLSLVSTYMGLQKYNHYHCKLNKMPMVIMDYQQDENQRKSTFSKYTAVVKNTNTKEAADMNAQKGLQWNVIYTTKDPKVANPVLADSDTTQNLVVVRGTGKAEETFSDVHEFGEEEAFDMNKHAYKNSTGGVYMHMVRADKSVEELVDEQKNGRNAQLEAEEAEAQKLRLVIAAVIVLGVVVIVVAIATRKKKSRPMDFE